MAFDLRIIEDDIVEMTETGSYKSFEKPFAHKGKKGVIGVDYSDSFHKISIYLAFLDDVDANKLRSAAAEIEINYSVFQNPPFAYAKQPTIYVKTHNVLVCVDDALEKIEKMLDKI